MCSDKASREVKQHDSNTAAETLLLPNAQESFSWYCRMCLRAAHSNGDIEASLRNLLSSVLNRMREVVYRNLALVREASVYESIIQQNISQSVAMEGQNKDEWSGLMLADAVQRQTTALSELHTNTKKARDIGDEASHILEEVSHVH